MSQLDIFDHAKLADTRELRTRITLLEAQLRGLQIYCEDLEGQLRKMVKEKKSTSN